jgi:hypothetical protein
MNLKTRYWAGQRGTIFQNNTLLKKFVSVEIDSRYVTVDFNFEKLLFFNNYITQHFFTSSFLKLSNNVFPFCYIAVCIQIYTVCRNNWLWPVYTELFKVRTLYFTISSLFLLLGTQRQILQKSLCVSALHVFASGLKLIMKQII